VAGGRRGLHIEELHNLYSSPSIIRMMNSKRMRWAGKVAQIGQKRTHIGHWWEGHKERDRPLGRERCRWLDNIKMDLSEIMWCDVDWIDLAQDRD
jgi:hypothetical protein